MASLTGLNNPPNLAPPPWTCKCDMYWLLSYSLSTTVPTDTYAPLEALSSYASPSESGTFHGGLSSVQIVRYQDSPVGPYDEIVFTPGKFSSPATGGKQNLRITRIYVSQGDTCYNGRANWNIPKHLARFAFTHPPGAPHALKVEVFPPSATATAPFFTALLTPFTLLPPFALATSYLPLDVCLVQPPLPSGVEGGGKGDGCEALMQGEEAYKELLCGTERWVRVTPDLRAERARGMWVDARVTGEGGWWPDQKPFKVGVWMEGVVLKFGEPDVL